MKNGQFQVYTGNGKGKTTAAVGLTLRALGAGYRVFFGQFIKDMEYGEVKMLRAIPGVTVELFGTGDGCMIFRKPNQHDFSAANAGVTRILEAMQGGAYDLVVADEVNVACTLGLLSAEQLVALAASRPQSVELVFTGRGAVPQVLALADLVTEMKETKHYYSEKGLLAREGIER